MSNIEEDIEIIKNIKRPIIACGFDKQTSILKAIEHILSKLEQDEKRIKELEVANKMQEYRINEMDIPKQKVKDIIEKRKNNCTVINSFVIEVLEELLEDN